MTEIDQQREATAKIKAALPQILGDTPYTFRPNAVRPSTVKWKDGICIDRVVQLLEKNGLDYGYWQHVIFNREVSFSPNISQTLSAMEITADDFDTAYEWTKKKLRNFYPQYTKHLEDEARLVALWLKRKAFGFADSDEELTIAQHARRKSFDFTCEEDIDPEVLDYIKLNRLYFAPEILTESNGEFVYKVNAGIKRAIARFYEEDDVRLNADLPKKPEGASQVIKD